MNADILAAWDKPDLLAGMDKFMPTDSPFTDRPDLMHYKDIQLTERETLVALLEVAGEANWRALAFTTRGSKARGQFMFTDAGIANIEALRP